MNISYKKQIILSTIFCCVHALSSQASLRRYIPFLQNKQQQETVTKEYTIQPECIITIKGTKAGVTCKTWDENKVSIVAIKQSAQQESLACLGVSDFVTPHSLTLTATEKEKNTKGSVHFDILVPKKASLNIEVGSGDITIQGPIAGKINANTQDGDICIDNAESHIIANSSHTGSICIKQAAAPLKATAVKGNITIKDSCNSVIALTTSGTISVKAQDVPATATIKAHSENGLIALELPKDINADLQACAKKGTITCQHPVTLKPRTTTLDQKAWRLFKEQVDGILGSGDASIVLHTSRGNIKILDGRVA